MRISVCMIVRDEAADLPRCLASLAGVADEIVVVDTGSADGTPELAAAAGARVLRIAWPRDFAAARNVSLEAATGDFCLALDADEELPAATRSALRDAVARADAAGLAGLSMIVRNLAPPGELTAWNDMPSVRVFRRAAAHRYVGRIHEQISPSIVRAGGRVGASDLVVLHHGYARPTAQGGVARAQRNLALLEEAVREAPDDAYLLYQLGATEKAVAAPAAAAHLERALALDEAAPAARRLLSGAAAADARMKLAQLALGRGADAQALAEARRCLALAPDNVVALQIVVLACVTLGRLGEAAEACRALLAAPNLAEAGRKDLAQLLAALGG